MKHGVSLERREGQWKSQPGGDGDVTVTMMDLYTTSRWVG
jgi:hypothetical protein